MTVGQREATRLLGLLPAVEILPTESLSKAKAKHPKLKPASPAALTPRASKARIRLEQLITKHLEEQGNKISQEAADAYDKQDTTDVAMEQLDLDSLHDSLATVVADHLDDVFAEAGTAALDSLEVTSADAFDLFNKDAHEYAARRGAELVGRKWKGSKLVDNPDAKWAISGTTRDSLRSSIASAYEQGLTPMELKEEILDSYAFSPERAKMIARTETATASVQGNLSAWRRSDVVKGKSWQLSNDHDQDDECLLGSTRVELFGEPLRGIWRWYEGPLVEIQLSNGNKLTGTPNHPVLTNVGWKPLGVINEGDHLLSASVLKRMCPRTSNFNHVVSRLENIVGSLRGRTTTRTTAPSEFHGDGIGSHVHAVTTNRFLWGKNQRSREKLIQACFVRGIKFSKQFPFNREHFEGCGNPFSSLFGAVSSRRQLLSSAPVPQFVPSTLQTRTNSGYPSSSTNLLKRERFSKVKINKSFSGNFRDELNARCRKIANNCITSELELFGNGFYAGTSFEKFEYLRAALISFALDFTLAAKRNTSFHKDAAYDAITDFQLLSNGIEGDPFLQIKVGNIPNGAVWERVLSRCHKTSRCKVFNLTMPYGFFAAEGIITRNCDMNEDDGVIDIDDMFSSGDDGPPAHPNCNCALVPSLEGPDEDLEEAAGGELAKLLKFKFGTVQFDLPPDDPAVSVLHTLQASISPDDLAGKGIEPNLHITFRHGLTEEDNWSDLQRYLRSIPEFQVQLGPVRAFPPTEFSDGAAPIYVEVQSAKVKEINAKLSDHASFNQPNFAEFQPHLALAYVNPDAAGKYTGNTVTQGLTLNVAALTIHSKDGTTWLRVPLAPVHEGWIGVDLDGTLAQHTDDKDVIGAPVPAMVARVRGWLTEGKRVRVFTARVAEDPFGERAGKIRAWTAEHVGTPLEVTAVKDPAMIELWDDKAVGVLQDTGARKLKGRGAELQKLISERRYGSKGK